jgi:hypothetical protein
MTAFISYKMPEDENHFKNIEFAFKAARIKYSTVKPTAGRPLGAELRQAIRKCAACVFIATRESLGSGWCKAEIGAFWGAGKPVVIYKVDKTLTDRELPPQSLGDKLAMDLPEVVDAMKVHLKQPQEDSPIDVIYTLAIESFIDKLALRFGTIHFVGFGTLMPGMPRLPAFRYVNAFGEEVHYDQTKVGADAESEIRMVIKRLTSLRQQKERQLVSALIENFTEVQGQSQLIAHHLGMISINGTTLAEPWRLARIMSLKCGNKRVMT